MNKIGKFFTLFCTITTCIFLCSSIFILIIWGKDCTLSISYVLGVIGLSLVTSLLYIPLLTEKELSKVQTIIFRIIYFIVTNVLVLIVGYKLHWFVINNIKMVIGMEITIICVFVLLNVVEYISGLSEAKKINDILSKRKKDEE